MKPIETFYRDLCEAARTKVEENIDPASRKAAAKAQIEHASVALSASAKPLNPELVDLAAIAAAALKTRLVFVSQYQTLPECRLWTARLLEALIELSPQTPLACGIDTLGPESSAALAALSKKRLSLAQFDKTSGLSKEFGARYWHSLQPILKCGARDGVYLFAADAAAGTFSLAKRNRQMHDKSVAWLKANPTGVCILMVGELRLRDGALYENFVEGFFSSKQAPLVVLQAWDEVFWWWLRKQEAAPPTAVDIHALPADGALQWHDHLYSVNHIPPLVKLDSYLTWSSGQETWPGWPPDEVAARVRQIIHKSLLLPEGTGASGKGEAPTIYCCGDVRLLQRMQDLDGLTAEEAEALKEQMQHFESFYLPRPNIIYLATLDGDHVGEEIGHSVRLHLSGESWPIPQWSKVGWLYYSSLNEAAAYLASKIVSPTRKTDRKSLRACERLYATADLEDEISDAVFENLSQEEIMVLGHRAGYGLGELLYRALQGGGEGKRRRLRRSLKLNDSAVPMVGLAPQALHALFTQPVTSEATAKRIFRELFDLSRKPAAGRETLHDRLHWVGFFYFLFFFVPALVWGEARDLFKFPKPVVLNWNRDLMIAAGSAAVVIILSLLLTKFVRLFRELGSEIRSFLGPLNIEEIFLVAAFSAIGEEFLFRGVLMAEAGLVLSSLLFAGLHFVPNRKFYPWPFFALGVGLLMGWSYQFTGNLFVPVVAHFLINLVNICVMVRKPASALNK